ncbi:MAG: hypothetical protein H6625_09645 [Bdellovibrionaceae bacterium]|nr:hypothetical protein [Pseudobdellovibrionaceae bacterium]
MTTSNSVSTALVATVTIGTVQTDWTVTTLSGVLKIFFTSQTNVGSAIGGLANADGICQSEAGVAGYAGSYKAVLSDDTTSAASRLTLSYPIVNAFNGSTVATTNLWIGSISNPLLNPFGSDNFRGTSWTGTTVTGDISVGNTCASWTGGTNGMRTVGANTNYK